MKTFFALFLLGMVFMVAAPNAMAMPQPEPPDLSDLDRWERLTEREREEKLRLYEERLKQLPEAERKRLLKLWEEKLKDLSPEGRKDLAERLERVKAHADLEELRQKQERVQSIEKRIFAKLPNESRERLETWPRPLRERIRKYCIGRIFWYARQEMLADLSPADRDTAARLKGREWFRTVPELLRARDLEALPLEERERIAALPEEERKEAERAVFHRANEERMERARNQLAAEIVEIIAMSRRDRERRFAEERGRYLLYRLGVIDPVVVERLQSLPPRAFARELKDLEKLAKMRRSPTRNKQLGEFLERLGR